MEEMNYSKQILEALSLNLTGTTSKVIASYIGKDEPFTRVYLNRLKRRNKVEIVGKRGRFNIYHISARTGYEHRIANLERKLKALEPIEELASHYYQENQKLKDRVQELEKRLV